MSVKIVQSVDCHGEQITYECFKEVEAKRKPTLFKDVEIGPCSSKWSTGYMVKSAGADTVVSVHASHSKMLDFLTKNFVYRKMAFADFIEQCCSTTTQPKEYLYYRALGSNPRRDVAHIEDIPSLAADVTIPEVIPSGSLFSSVYRISSPGLQLWTHYDVMDNFLIQVRGEKEVVLFPPSDANRLYLKGDKSQVVDVNSPDLTKFPKFAKVTRYECRLTPRDVLFIPALWFHNIRSVSNDLSNDLSSDLSNDQPSNLSKDLSSEQSNDLSKDQSKSLSNDLSSDLSRDLSKDQSNDLSSDLSRDLSRDLSKDQAVVSVNTFWRHLPPSQYPPRDLYGNRDVVAAARAAQLVDTACRAVASLPGDYRDFYGRLLVARIKNNLYSSSPV